MPNAADSPRVPSYRRHKPSGQAVVTLSGRDVYLGRWNTRASRDEYDRLIGEWPASGRCLPAADGGACLSELALAYWRHARDYYRKNGVPTGSIHRIRIATRTLRQTYGHTLARDFVPLALQAVQRQLAESGKSRRYVNDLIDEIRRIFKWGAARETMPGSVYRAPTIVSGLRKEGSERKRLADRHARRRTLLSCGNKPGSNRKRRPKRRPRGRYDTNSYRQAIHRAVSLANRERLKEPKAVESPFHSVTATSSPVLELDDERVLCLYYVEEGGGANIQRCAISL